MNATYPAQALDNENAMDSARPAPNFKFRLVRICPAVSTDAPIQCSLEVIMLGDPKIQYEALSYHWGEPQHGVEISLGGQAYLVTSNLHSALQHLRDPTNHRLFFIDALCIDQNNIMERSSQVQAMWEIYQHAWRVVVFLGEQCKYTAEAFGWIISAGEELKQFRCDIIQGVASGIFSDQTAGRARCSIHKGLRDILSRPWWR